MFVRIWCLFMGHEDTVRAREQRVFLCCSQCGRESHGWDVATHDQPSPMHAQPHGVLA